MSAGNTRTAQPRYPYVQALRALAAASVAMDHVGHDLIAASPTPSPLLVAAWNAMPWKAGVDIFFVISGFVIVHASRALFATTRGPALFIARRLARIVPLYWLATSLFLASMLLVPSAIHGTIHGTIGGLGYIVRSYLFIPAARPDGLVEPVFGLGWTLAFEMLFYVVLTPFIVLPRVWAVLATTTALTALYVANVTGKLDGVALTTWADPIVFEFAAGMWLALAAGHVALGRVARAALALAALVALHVAPDAAGAAHAADALPRVIAWGGPAAMLVAAATLGRREGHRVRLERLLERLGDASYALYLCHPFVMRPAALAWRHVAPRAGILALPCALAIIAVSQLAALVIHARIERPVTRAARRAISRIDRAHPRRHPGPDGRPPAPRPPIA